MLSYVTANTEMQTRKEVIMSVEAAVDTIGAGTTADQVQTQLLLDANNDGAVSGTEFRNYFYQALSDVQESADPDSAQQTQNTTTKLMDLLVPLAVELIGSYLDRTGSINTETTGQEITSSSDSVDITSVTFDQQGRTDFDPLTEIKYNAYSFDGKNFRFDETPTTDNDYWRVFYSVDGTNFDWVDDSSDDLNVSGEGEFKYAVAVRKSGGRTPIIGIDS